MVPRKRAFPQPVGTAFRPPNHCRMPETAVSLLEDEADGPPIWGMSANSLIHDDMRPMTDLTEAIQPILYSGRANRDSRLREIDSLRAEYATALGKKGSLESVIAEHGYSTESVRRLFQSGALQGGRAPVGVLADFLEVEPRYEAVVEDFLRDELNYIVVKSWDAVAEGLRLLRSDVDGRGSDE